MLRYKDFAPRVLEEAALLSRPKYDTFEHAVEAAAAWIKDNNLDVINIETVVLPNIGTARMMDPEAPRATNSPVLDDYGARYGSWYQIVRVWHR
jgi:hypothetical protein